MALNFPDSPTNGQKYTDATTGETWTYEASTNSWTSDGLTTASGIQYKGGIDITVAPPAGVANGWQYTVTTGGTANAGFTGLSGSIPVGTTILYDGTNWQQAGAGVIWNRTGTALNPVNAGDTVQISAGTAALPGLTPVGDPNTGVFSAGADQIGLATNGTGRLFVDASGRVLVGTSTARGIASSTSALIQVEAGSSLQFAATANRADGVGPFFCFGKSRGTSSGSNNIVNSGDQLGTIRFAGADGTDIQSIGAAISAEVDGTPGTNNMPGRLVLSTTPSGSATPQERLRLTSDGKLGLGTSSPSAVIHSYQKITGGNPATSGSTDANVFARFQGESVAFDIGGTAGGLQWIQPRLYNDYSTNFGLTLCPNGGNVGIGTMAPGVPLSVQSASGAGNVIDAIGRSADNISILRFLNSAADTELGRLAHYGNDLDLRNTANFGITFATNNTEKARIDASGRLLVGTSSALPVLGGPAKFQVAVGDEFAASIGRWSANEFGPAINLYKSRSASVGAYSLLSSGDEIGTGFRADDGSGGNFVVAANIRCEVDGTPGANDTPASLVLSTTPSKKPAPVERLRIASTGRVTVTNSSVNPPGTLAGTGNVAIDLVTANNFNMSMTGSVTFDNPTNAVAGQSGSIVITNPSTHTLSFGTNWKFAGGVKPTLPASTTSVLAYYVVSPTMIVGNLLGDVK